MMIGRCVMSEAMRADKKPSTSFWLASTYTGGRGGANLNSIPLFYVVVLLKGHTPQDKHKGFPPGQQRGCLQGPGLREHTSIGRLEGEGKWEALPG